MKRFRTIVTFMAAIMLTLSFVSCGGLSGTYVSVEESPNIDGRICKITFDGDTCTLVDHIDFVFPDMNWEVSDNKLLISGIWNSFLGATELSYEYEFRQEGDSIFLDGAEFKKS